MIIYLGIALFYGLIFLGLHIAKKKFNKNLKIAEDNLDKIDNACDGNLKIASYACDNSPTYSGSEIKRIYDISRKANDNLFDLIADGQPYSLNKSPWKKTLPLTDKIMAEYILIPSSFYPDKPSIYFD